MIAPPGSRVREADDSESFNTFGIVPPTQDIRKWESIDAYLAGLSQIFETEELCVQAKVVESMFLGKASARGEYSRGVFHARFLL